MTMLTKAQIKTHLEQNHAIDCPAAALKSMGLTAKEVAASCHCHGEPNMNQTVLSVDFSVQADALMKELRASGFEPTLIDECNVLVDAPMDNPAVKKLAKVFEAELSAG